MKLQALLLFLVFVFLAGQGQGATNGDDLNGSNGSNGDNGGNGSSGGPRRGRIGIGGGVIGGFRGGVGISRGR